MLERIQIIKNNIRLACEKWGRNLDEITLVAASKTVDFDTLSKLKSCGIFICGENRVQELTQKYGKVDTEWHFIGRLQTNKVKYIVDKVSLIQSLDRIELAQEIQSRCQKIGKIMDCLVEVNISGEESKGGIEPHQLEQFLEDLKAFKNIRIQGLMTIAKKDGDHIESKKNYLHMKAIYDTLKKEKSLYHGEMKVLSMGMSDDYGLAVECGSTMVRIGQAIFGKRETL